MTTSAKLVPNHRPRFDPAEVHSIIEDLIAAHAKAGLLDADALRAHCPVGLFGNRGHFRDSVGKRGENDLGYFDDAIARVRLVHGLWTVEAAFNANVDPSRAGFNAGVGKDFAQLDEEQIVYTRWGRHKKTPKRLRQLTDEEAALADLDLIDHGPQGEGEYRIQRIERDNVGKTVTGYWAINFHEGGFHGTSSWGCQTIVVEQTVEFFDGIYAATEGTSQRWDPEAHVYGVIPYFFTARRMK